MNGNVLLYFMIKLMTQMQIGDFSEQVCGSTVVEGKAWRAHPEPASLFES